MRTLVLPRSIPGVGRAGLVKHAQAEVRAARKLHEQGICSNRHAA